MRCAHKGTLRQTWIDYLKGCAGPYFILDPSSMKDLGGIVLGLTIKESDEYQRGQIVTI